MLKTLLKHEFKNSYLEITIINIAIMVISLISALLLSLDNIVLFVLPFSSLFLLIGVVFVLLIINTVKTFNQKIFSKEGYLTLTLPISIDSLIISKIIITVFWFTITFLVIAFSTIFFVMIASNYNTEILMGLYAFIKDLHILFVISILFQSLIQILSFILVLLFTVTFLNIGVVRKYKLLVGVGIYYIINQIFNWIKMLIIIIPFGVFFKDDVLTLEKIDLWTIFNPLTPGLLLNINSLFFDLLIIFGFYFLSRYLITKKLELE